MNTTRKIMSDSPQQNVSSFQIDDFFFQIWNFVTTNVFYYKICIKGLKQFFISLYFPFLKFDISPVFKTFLAAYC